MTKRRLLFHVGSHKTGTTALQRTFAAAREQLARDGVIYPDLVGPLALDGPAPSHSAVVKAAEWAEGADRLSRIAADLDRTVPPGGTAFLSAELAYRLSADGVEWTDGDAFWAARARLLTRLRTAFDAFDLTFLLYLRRPDRLAESHYAESMAATEGSLRVDEFVRAKPYRYDYHRQVALFRSIAPTVVRHYEDVLRSDGLVASVCDTLGIDRLPGGSSWMRPSVSIRAQLWLRQAKAATPLSKRARDRRWLFALDRGDKTPFDGPPASIWPSAEARRSFVDTALAGFDELAWEAPDARSLPACTWTPIDHARAEAAFEIWQTDQSDRLSARENARLKPFEPDPR